MSTSPLDLQQLARPRSAETPGIEPPATPWFSRYGVPVGILAAMIAVMGWALRDAWWPRHLVTVVPVMTERGAAAAEGTALFQAAGWIEPRPSPVQATSLAEGIVAEVYVVEGQAVDAGQPLARLIDTDARLAVRRAEAAVELQRAALQRAQAERTAAQQRFDQPVHLRADLAEAQSQFARTETELAKLPFLIRVAEAQLRFAETTLANREAAHDAVPARLIQQAQSERETAQATVAELRQRIEHLHRERTALEQRVAALELKLELRIEESRAVAEAEANERAAQAQLLEAEVAAEHAALVLERTTIRAPLAGKVLRLYAQPGTSMLGLDAAGGHSSSTVALLYDPQSLQVRADVRLEDFSLVEPGQPVTFETPTATAPLRGRVLQATAQANIQKNTVEVKVSIDEAPETVRPEMLVTATFWALPRAATSAAEAETLRVLVPRQLVESRGDAAEIWVVGNGQRAELRRVTLGRATASEWIEVASGLTPTDKLISAGREGLRAGMKLSVRHAD